MPAPTAKKSMATTDKMVSSERPKPWPNLQGGGQQGCKVACGSVGVGCGGWGRAGFTFQPPCTPAIALLTLSFPCCHCSRLPSQHSAQLPLTRGSRRWQWRPLARSRRPQMRGRPAPSGSWSACGTRCVDRPSWARCTAGASSTGRTWGAGGRRQRSGGGQAEAAVAAEALASPRCAQGSLEVHLRRFEQPPEVKGQQGVSPRLDGRRRANGQCPGGRPADGQHRCRLLLALWALDRRGMLASWEVAPLSGRGQRAWQARSECLHMRSHITGTPAGCSRRAPHAFHAGQPGQGRERAWVRLAVLWEPLLSFRVAAGLLRRSPAPSSLPFALPRPSPSPPATAVSPRTL